MQYDELCYIPESDDTSITIETARLVAKVIDNTGLLAPSADESSYFNSSHRFTPFTHHLGYHGIRTLYDKAERRNLVVPFVSWLNLQSAGLEGIEPDPVDERAWAGRGRCWPIRLERTGAGVALRLDPLPRMRLSYRLELRPAEPDGIDFSVRFEFAKRPKSGPARFRASWPCYVNGYDDVRLFYPKGTSAGDWEWHNMGETPDLIIGEPVHYQQGQSSFRAERQAMPLGYGRIGSRALILMFNDPAVRLFTVNTGGHFFCSPVQNPAWDFEWAVEDYPIGESIGFDGGLIYTSFEGPEQVVDRYRQWRNGPLGG